MSMDRSVSVVVPAYNSERTLRECLAAIHAQTRPPVEVIVVDDASSDSTRDIAREFAVILLETPVNRGPAAARNRGIRASHGDILFFVDSDCALSADAIEQALRILDENPDVACVHGMYLTEPLLRRRAGGGLPAPARPLLAAAQRGAGAYRDLRGLRHRACGLRRRRALRREPARLRGRGAQRPDGRPVRHHPLPGGDLPARRRQPAVAHAAQAVRPFPDADPGGGAGTRPGRDPRQPHDRSAGRRADGGDAAGRGCLPPLAAIPALFASCSPSPTRGWPGSSAANGERRFSCTSWPCTFSSSSRSSRARRSAGCVTWCGGTSAPPARSAPERCHDARRPYVVGAFAGVPASWGHAPTGGCVPRGRPGRRRGRSSPWPAAAWP